MGLFGGIANRMRSVDAFPKLADELRVRTASGGILSIIAGLLLTYLVAHEIHQYLKVERVQTLGVDADEKGREEKLKIKFDIDLPWINCEVMGVDAIDVYGNSQLEISENVFKTPISHTGEKLHHRTTRVLTPLSRLTRSSSVSPSPPPPNYCGSCYGAGTHCCNTCESVYKAYEQRGWSLQNFHTHFEQCQREGITDPSQLNAAKRNIFNPKEGCNIRGEISVLRLEGSFHVAPGHSFEFQGRQLHDLSILRGNKMDLSHTINKLTFGEEYPGMINPLDQKEKKAEKDRMGQHEYYIKVVPTHYQAKRSRGVMRTNQFSVTESFKESDTLHGVNVLPGVFFHYAMSPIRITVEERRKSTAHFLVQLCAIVGGVVTISGLMDKGFYLGARAWRKRHFGKLA